MGAAAWASIGSVRMRNAAAADAAAESVKKERRDAEIVLMLDTSAFDTGAFGTAHLTSLILSQIEGGLEFRLWARGLHRRLGIAIQRMT